MNNYAEIPLTQLVSFIEANGWSSNKNFNDNFNCWTNDSWSDYEITLPKSQEHRRYKSLMFDALEQLSEVENTNVDDLIKMIVVENFDNIFVRAIGDDVKEGIIPFGDGLNFLSAIHKLLKSASKDLKKFKNQSTHIGSFFNELGLGQTQVGSYVVSVHSPLYRLPSTNQIDLDSEASSLGRMINLSLFKKLTKITSIFASSDDVVPQLLSLGLTSKECDSLIDLFGNKSHRDIEFKFDWSEKEKIPSAYKKTIMIRACNAKDLIEFREVLKVKTTKRSVTLSGEVADLHRTYEDEMGVAKLRAKYNNKQMKVSFNIDDKDYQQVAEAHANKKTITISGNLILFNYKNTLTASLDKVSNLIVNENVEIEA
ncbi:hypothetical protein AB6C54_20590 [Vibrio splendidus]